MPTFREIDLHGEPCSNGVRHLVLQVEELFDVYGKVIGPQDAFRLGLDQFDPDTHALSRSAQTAGEKIAHSQAPADFPGGTGLEAKQKSRVPRDDQEIPEAAELCYDVLDDSFA